MRNVFCLTALTTLLALAGCVTIGPDYQSPAPAPVKTLHGFDASMQNSSPFEAAWWKQFGDPILDALIQRAMQDSLDLGIALSRVRESRALLRGTEAHQLPTVDAVGALQRSREQLVGLGPTPKTIETAQLGFDASWELDLFGGIRRAVEVSEANLQASEASLRDAQVMVIAEVARNYFVLRGTQLRMNIAQRDIENQRDTLKLIRARYEVGRSSEQDVSSAASRLSGVEAQVPLLETQAQAAQFRLAVLLGSRPGDLDIDLSPKSFRPILTSLPIGGAEQVLARRPDIRIAERELAAANARIGVAKSEFFPRVSLGGFIGFLTIAGAGFGGGQFGGPNSLAWSLGPSISWSGLNVQRARANLHVSEARADAALANYQQTVLRALEEVSNGLVAYNQERVRMDRLVEQTQQSKRAADLARIRYLGGATDFLQLLDAQRTQLAAEDELARTEAAINIDTVAIYKAIGGGWEACGDERCSQVSALVSNGSSKAAGVGR
ncbi:efflux transporter outer membrane subunit [Caballeronia sp. NK8]|uniref:efflux transporter outer membrane subunit n=1 Tax=Caballeronia sp. NK8 TaxID=140098 RepID=UPI001BB706CA|nr:efflux transporter outer membrane subunit [Caballeronia sp. NK8]BCQ26877.1 efflux transporter outer membrane subunit [Caballeronia sp. NK8]